MIHLSNMILIISEHHEGWIVFVQFDSLLKIVQGIILLDARYTLILCVAIMGIFVILLLEILIIIFLKMMTSRSIVASPILLLLLGPTASYSSFILVLAIIFLSPLIVFLVFPYRQFFYQLNIKLSNL